MLMTCFECEIWLECHIALHNFRALLNALIDEQIVVPYHIAIYFINIVVHLTLVFISFWNQDLVSAFT